MPGPQVFPSPRTPTLQAGLLELRLLGRGPARMIGGHPPSLCESAGVTTQVCGRARLGYDGRAFRIRVCAGPRPAPGSRPERALTGAADPGGGAESCQPGRARLHSAGNGRNGERGRGGGLSCAMGVQQSKPKLAVASSNRLPPFSSCLRMDSPGNVTAAPRAVRVLPKWWQPSIAAPCRLGLGDSALNLRMVRGLLDGYAPPAPSAAPSAHSAHRARPSSGSAGDTVQSAVRLGPTADWFPTAALVGGLGATANPSQAGLSGAASGNVPGDPWLD